MKFPELKIEIINIYKEIQTKKTDDIEKYKQILISLEQEVPIEELNKKFRLNYNENNFISPYGIIMEAYFKNSKHLNQELNKKHRSIEKRFNNSKFKTQIEDLIFPSIFDLLPFTVDPKMFAYKTINQCLEFEQKYGSNLNNPVKQEIFEEIQNYYLNQIKKEYVKKKENLYQNMLYIINSDRIFKDVQLFKEDITSYEIIWFKKHLPKKGVARKLSNFI